MTNTLPPALRPFRTILTELAERWVTDGVVAVRLGCEDARVTDANDGPVLAGEVLAEAASFRLPLELPGAAWFLEVSTTDPPAAVSDRRSRCGFELDLATRLSRRENELAEMTGALIDANDQLLALYDLAASSATSLSRHEVLQTLVDDARRLTGSSAAVIMVAGECFSSGPKDLAEGLRRQCEDSENHGRLLRADRSGEVNDVVIHALGEEQQGVLAVAAQAGSRLTTPQLKLVEAVGSHVSGMAALAGLHEQEIASAVMERDVTTAAALAAQVLPKGPPAIAGLDVIGRCDPARFAAGDFFTYVEADGGLVFVAGDVSGKGLPAALVMTMVSSTATAVAHRERGADPAVLLNALSRDVYGYLSDVGMFVTIVVARWEVDTDHVLIANAGHSPVLLRNSFEVQPIAPTAPPLGVLADMGDELVRVPFLPGDLLLLGTDGLAEQENADGVQLGYDDLRSSLASTKTTTSQGVLDELFALVEDHGLGVAQDDDRTALVVRRRHPQEERT